MGETIVTLRQGASLQGSVGGGGRGVTCSPPKILNLKNRKPQKLKQK